MDPSVIFHHTTPSTMVESSVAEVVLGVAGAAVSAISALPQVWKAWHYKSTDGLSPWLMLLWALSDVFLGIYCISDAISIPFIFQLQLSCSLSIIAWAQCLFYDKKHALMSAVLLGVFTSLAFGGLEAGFAFITWDVLHHGNGQLAIFFAIFATCLNILGAIPQYVEIWRHQEVGGLSIPFISLNLLGTLLSMVSLFFSSRLDVLLLINCIVVMVIDISIVAIAVVVNPLARRRRAKEAMIFVEKETWGIPMSPLTVTRGSESVVWGDSESSLPEMLKGPFKRSKKDLDASSIMSTPTTGIPIINITSPQVVSPMKGIPL